MSLITYGFDGLSDLLRIVSVIGECIPIEKLRGL